MPNLTKGLNALFETMEDAYTRKENNKFIIPDDAPKNIKQKIKSIINLNLSQEEALYRLYEDLTKVNKKNHTRTEVLSIYNNMRENTNSINQAIELTAEKLKISKSAVSKHIYRT